MPKSRGRKRPKNAKQLLQKGKAASPVASKHSANHITPPGQTPAGFYCGPGNNPHRLVVTIPAGMEPEDGEYADDLVGAVLFEVDNLAYDTAAETLRDFGAKISEHDGKIVIDCLDEHQALAVSTLIRSEVTKDPRTSIVIEGPTGQREIINRSIDENDECESFFQLVNDDAILTQDGHQFQLIDLLSEIANDDPGNLYSAFDMCEIIGAIQKQLAETDALCATVELDGSSSIIANFHPTMPADFADNPPDTFAMLWEQLGSEPMPDYCRVLVRREGVALCYVGNTAELYIEQEGAFLQEDETKAAESHRFRAWLFWKGERSPNAEPNAVEVAFNASELKESAGTDEENQGLRMLTYLRACGHVALPERIPLLVQPTANQAIALFYENPR